jgi:hypothetical protein
VSGVLSFDVDGGALQHNYTVKRVVPQRGCDAVGRVRRKRRTFVGALTVTGREAAHVGRG